MWEIVLTSVDMFLPFPVISQCIFLVIATQKRLGRWYLNALRNCDFCPRPRPNQGLGAQNRGLGAVWYFNSSSDDDICADTIRPSPRWKGTPQNSRGFFINQFPIKFLAIYRGCITPPFIAVYIFFLADLESPAKKPADFFLKLSEHGFQFPKPLTMGSKRVWVKDSTSPLRKTCDFPDILRKKMEGLLVFQI